MYTYRDVVGIGKWAVARFAEHLESTGAQVVDVQEDDFFRILDVDLVVSRPLHHRPLLVEVKGDRYKSGNVYVERVSNVTKSTPGCLLYTCADVVAYYFVNEGRALWIPMSAMKRWMAQRLRDFPEKRTQTVKSDKQLMFESIGHTVPIQVVIDEVGATVIEGLPMMEGHDEVKVLGPQTQTQAAGWHRGGVQAHRGAAPPLRQVSYENRYHA